MRSSPRGSPDHRSGTVLDRPVQRTESALLHQTGERAPPRRRRQRPHGPALGPSPGRPSAVAHRVPANEPDAAPTRTGLGVSKSAADRIVAHLGPLLAMRPRQRFRKGTVLIVDGTLVPTRDHQVAEQSKNYRYSTAHQVVIDADTRLVGQPPPSTSRNGPGGQRRRDRPVMGTVTERRDPRVPGFPGPPDSQTPTDRGVGLPACHHGCNRAPCPRRPTHPVVWPGKPATAPLRYTGSHHPFGRSGCRARSQLMSDLKGA